MGGVIDVSNVSVRFGRTEALKEVSFSVGTGEIVGLVGPNGSGKSTMLRTVAGLARPTTGSVLVDGSKAGTLAARQQLGLVPDDPSGVGLSTVQEFCRLVGHLWGDPDGFDDRLAAGLDVFGLSARRHVLMDSLSNGQRRIVTMIAIAAVDPLVWLVDEATATLDPEAVIVLRELLRNAAARGAAVLLATQDLPFAASICDRTVLLSGGRVLDIGSPVELADRYDVSSLEDAFVAATFGSDHLEGVRRVLGTF